MIEKKVKKIANNFHELETLLADESAKPIRHNSEGSMREHATPIKHSQVTEQSKNNIQLTRSIHIRCWRVVGQIAKAVKRPELMPVLLRARELGATDATDIAGHLLFEPVSRRTVAQRLLQIAESFGLLEQHERRYVLTASGRVALDEKQVFVPEDGTWTIWASNDPLLATPILRVDPWSEPTASDEVWGKKSKTEEKRKFEKLPPWLKAITGVVTTPIAAGGRSIRIDNLKPEGEVVTDAPEALQAAWDVSESKLRIKGTLSGANVNTIVDAPDVSVEQAWKQLLESEGIWPQWDQSASTLRVNFDDTTASERESFLRTLLFKTPSIEKLGRFDAATVENVPVSATSALDANSWAKWRLSARINSYATAEKFSTWNDEAVAPLAEFQPSTPSRQTLADAAWQARSHNSTTHTWHLVAAEDWGL